MCQHKREIVLHRHVVEELAVYKTVNEFHGCKHHRLASKRQDVLRQLDVRIGSKLKHLLEHLFSGRKGPEQRGHVSTALGIHINARLNQPVDLLDIFCLNRFAQRDDARIGEEVLCFPFEPLVHRACGTLLSQGMRNIDHLFRLLTAA